MKRWISILLCMTLMFTSIAGDIAWAATENEAELQLQTTDAETGDVEVVSENEDAEIGLADNAGDTGLTVDYGTDDSESNDDYALEIVENDIDASTFEFDADVGKALSEIDDFSFGYAKLIADAEVYAEAGTENAALAKISRGSVVLCVDRAQNQLKITFNTEKGVIAGYVAAASMAMMSETEIIAFMNEAAAYDNVVLYENNLDYPISCLDCEFIDHQGTNEQAETKEKQTEVSSEPDQENMTSAEPVDNGQNGDTSAEPVENEQNDDTPVEPVDNEQNGDTPAKIVKDDNKENSEEPVNDDFSTYTFDENAQIPALMSASAPVATSLDTLVLPVLASLSPANAVSMAIGESFNLEALDENGIEISGVQLALPEQPSGAISLEDNLVTAKAVGSETITVTYNGAALNCVVSVFKAPASISVDKTTLTLHEGMKQKLNVSFDSEDAASLINFTCSGETEGIVSVDREGNVTALKAGVCKIIVSASTEGISPVEVSVTVKPGPTQINLDDTQLLLGAGEKAKLTFETANGVGSDDTFTFNSSNSVAVAVDQQGQIEAIAKGKATITVTASNGVSAQCAVEVLAAPTRMTFSEDISIGVGQKVEMPEMTLYAGENEISTGKIINVYSNDSETAIVEDDGSITGVKLGSTTIVVTAYNGVKGSLKVNVLNRPTSLTIEPADAELSAGGQQLQLKPVFNNGAAGEVTYTSDNAAAVSVDKNGVVTTGSYGQATITARTIGSDGNDLTARAYITVLNAPAQVMLSKEMITLGVDFSDNLTASAQDANGKSVNAAYTYRVVQDGDYIKFDEKTGKITACGVGTAKIYVQTHNGVSQHWDAETSAMVETVCTVEVRGVPKTLQLNASRGYVGYNEIYTGLKATVYDEDGRETDATYKVWSSNSSYVRAAYDADADIIKIQGRKVGKSAYVYVQTNNGLKKSIKVTVKKAPTKCNVSPSSVKLAAGLETGGQTYQLKVGVNSGAICSTYTYASSNENVVTVSASGKLTAINPGTATITVKTYNGYKGYCKVTVVDAPDQVYFPTDTLTIGVDQSSTVKAAARRTDGAETQASFTYYTEDTDYISLDSSTGAIKGLKTGTATITVKTHNGITQYAGEIDKKIVATCTVKIVAAPEKIELNYSGTKTIGYKETFTGLKATLIGPTGENGEVEETAGTYTFSIVSGSKYINLNKSNGYVYGKKTGTATVRVTSYNGKTATVKIKVAKAPTKVALNTSSVTLALGGSIENGTAMTYQLAAKVNSGAASGGYTYASSNNAVATVDANGLITAVGEGTATIAVKTYNNKRATCKVTVKAEPATVKFGTESLTLGVDQKYTLKVSAYDANGADTVAKYTFSSSNPDAVYINPSTGEITAKAEIAEAVITVTAHNGAYAYNKEGVLTPAQCRVKVVAAPERIELNYSGTKTIGYKETFTGLKATLIGPTGEDGEPEETAGTYTFSIVSGSKYINLNKSNGYVYGKKTGTATVRVTSYNGKTATVKIKVAKAPTKITLNTGSVTLAMGKYEGTDKPMTYQLSVKANSGAASGGYTCTSSDTNVATINTNGLITAVGKGTATITVKSYNNKKATCKVTVLDEPGQVFLPETITTAEGMTGTISASVKAIDGSASTTQYTYSTVDGTGSLTIDPSTGAITGKIAGEAEIRVKTHNGVSTHLEDGVPVETVCKVKIIEAPTDMRLNASSVTIGVGEKFTVKGTLIAEDGSELIGGKVYFSRSNSKITVNSSGVVQGKSTGTAYVYVKSYNGIQKKLKVVVKKAPKSVSITPTNGVLGVGQTGQYKAKFSSSYGGGHTFTSSNTNVATIDSVTGVVTAKAVGTTTITVKTYNGKKKTTKLTVKKGPEFMLLSGAGLQQLDVVDFIANDIINAEVFTGHIYSKIMEPGDTFQISATKEAYTYGNIVSYESSDAEIAAVSSAGKIQALKPGMAIIAVTASSGAEEYIVVIVDDASAKLEFETDKVELLVGEVVPVPDLVGLDDPLYKATLEYSSDSYLRTYQDEETGEWFMKGMKAGKGTLIVRTVHANSASIPVTVKSQYTGDVTVRVAKKMAIGDVADISVSNVIAGDYELNSSDTSVAVIENGKLKAVGKGVVTVSATMLDGEKFVSNKITVSAKPVEVKLESQKKTLEVNEQYQLNPNVGEAYTTFSYVSNNEAVASVDQNGKITAVAPGKARITVNTSVSDVFTYCDIIVKAALPTPDKATLITKEILMSVGGASESIEVEFSREDGAECAAAQLTFKSDPENIATVENGVVTAKATGKANITVSAMLNGKETEIGVCKVTVKATEEILAITPKSLSLIENGESGIVTVTLTKGDSITSATVDGDIAKATYSENVITVVPEKIGSAKLTITSANGCMAICDLTVEAKPSQPTGITVNNPGYTLGIGETFDIGAKLNPADSAGIISYTSENTDVVTVKDGVITAVGCGATTIKVICGEISENVNVKVGYAPESIRMVCRKLNLLVGTTYSLTEPALICENGNASGGYTLAISNPQIADLDEEGNLVAKAKGSTLLMAQTYNGVKAYMEIIVSAEPVEISFIDEKIQLAVGETYAPTVLSDAGAQVNAEFISDNAEIVRVDVNNQLVGVSTGEAKITAKYGNIEADEELIVTVGEKAQNVTLNVKNVKLAVGETFQLKAETDGMAAEISYSSQYDHIASVQEDGLITALHTGTTIIEATVYGGAKNYCTVTVVKAPSMLSVTPGEITASLAENGVQLEWSFGSSEEGGEVTFTVAGGDEGANENAISVSDSGYVTFKETGWANVVAKTCNGISVIVPVTVTSTPGMMSFEQPDMVIVKGDAVLNPVVFPGNTSANYTLSGGDNIVSAEKSGASVKFTALAVGKTTITATTAFGLSTTCNVEVVEAVSSMTLSPDSLSLYLGERSRLSVSFTPENVKATVEFASQNNTIATVDADGYVTGIASGTTVVEAQMKIDGKTVKTARCNVTVNGARRKMFIAHSYYDAAYGKTALYFSYNNARGMKNVFSQSDINGESYEMKFMTNPSKNSLLGGLTSYFADSTDNDVNVIYLLSHGHREVDGSQYGLSLPGYTDKYSSPYYYITATELMACISQVKGRVVLILDSCYSGVFIDNMRSKLDSAGGRISVLTAASNTNASYWLEKNVNKDVDFFTFSLLEGLGYNGQTNKYVSSALSADSNGNGQVTVQELYNFASSKTKSYVKQFSSYSKFRGNKNQTTSCYIGSNAGLVIFDPK